MEFSTRGKVTKTPVCELKRYEAKDGPYAVVLVHKTMDASSRWLAIKVEENGELIVGRHRKRHKAEQKCNEHSKQQSKRKRSRRSK